jgi:hypothetical protein
MQKKRGQKWLQRVEPSWQSFVPSLLFLVWLQLAELERGMYLSSYQRTEVDFFFISAFDSIPRESTVSFRPHPSSV